MEEYLMQLFEQDGAAIFHTDYQLFLKLLDKYPKGPSRDDTYCINAIIGGNNFYKSIITALKNDNHSVSHSEYNVIVAQMYNGDRFWKNENYEPSHFEYILRMLYRVASVDVADIPMNILDTDTRVNTKEELMEELASAHAAYENKNYRAAVEKSKLLFGNGVGSAATILSKAYYHGNGTVKDYNKALYYLSYPHKKTRQQEKDERIMLDELLDLRDKSMNSSIICFIGSIVLFLFMVITGFFSRHMLFALFNFGTLIVGCTLFVMTYKKKLIFDFSWWFLVLGCMFLIILIL